MGEENVITWATADAFVPGVLVDAPGASYTMYWVSSAALNNTYYKPNAPEDRRWFSGRMYFKLRLGNPPLTPRPGTADAGKRMF